MVFSVEVVVTLRGVVLVWVGWMVVDFLDLDLVSERFADGSNN